VLFHGDVGVACDWLGGLAFTEIITFSGSEEFKSKAVDSDTVEWLLLNNEAVLDIPGYDTTIQDDITLMIETDIERSRLARKLSRSPELRKAIIQNLSEGDQRMFLLPNLMVEDLSTRHNREEMHKLMSDLPAGLPQYYIKILELSSCLEA
jgi:hypothetical protein